MPSVSNPSVTRRVGHQAVALAVQRHWIQTDGSVPSHSVALNMRLL